MEDKKIKVYLAGPWSYKEQMKVIKKVFEDAGFNVVSRWIDLHVEKPDEAQGGWAEANEAIMKREAVNDIEDVKDAAVLVLLNIQPRGQESTGKAVETGLAIAWNKPVILVGDKTNVFHYLDSVFQVDGITQAIDTIRSIWGL